MATQVTLNSGSVDSAGSLALKTNGTTTAVTINSSQGVEFNAGTAALPSITTTGDTNTGIFFPAADTIAFAEGGVEAMRLNSAGNMGLGVTPEGWSLIKGLQVTGGGFFGSYLNNSYMGANWYFDGTNKYIASDFATQYEQNDGKHAWYTAASGTAGNAITFTQAMTLDASGNLGIGTTSPSSTLHLSGTLPILTFTDSNDSSTSRVYQDNEAFAIDVDFANAKASSNLQFRIDNTERARIDSSGNLLVGATSAVLTTSRLTVDTGSSTAAGVFRINGTNNTNLYVCNQSNSAYQPLSFRVDTSTEVGAINCTTSATSYVTSSDYRLKESVQPMTGALAKVALLKPCTYTWKADGSDGQGFIAHELQAVIPDCVVGEKDAVNEDGSIKPQGIDTSFLVATLTAAIQELKTLVDTQASTIQSLTTRITALEQA